MKEKKAAKGVSKNSAEQLHGGGAWRAGAGGARAARGRGAGVRRGAARSAGRAPTSGRRVHIDAGARPLSSRSRRKQDGGPVGAGSAAPGCACWMSARLRDAAEVRAAPPPPAALAGCPAAPRRRAGGAAGVAPRACGWVGAAAPQHG